MTWAAPVAFAGLALLAIPVLIHLLGLGQSVERRFPSLRFIATSRLQPARRTRLHDLPLLLIRLAALAAAVFALARPVARDGVPVTAGSVGSRVVIVDTSASMRRSGADARAARLADSVAGASGASGAAVAIVRTAAPTMGLTGAAAWLATQPGRGEVVIVSDFQVGAIDSAGITDVPAAIAVRLLRAEPGGRTQGATPDGGLPVRERFLQAGKEVTADARVRDGATDVTWTGRVGTGAREVAAPAVIVRAAPADARAVNAAVRASELLAAPAEVQYHNGDSVFVVLPAYDGRDALLRSAAPIDAPWQGDVLVRVARDPAFMATGRAVPRAVVTNVGGRDHLTLFAETGADDPATMALIAAVQRAQAGGAPSHELEPAVLSDSALDVLRAVALSRGTAALGRRDDDRPGTLEGGPGATNESSPFARWLWALALAMLGVEAIVRRVSARPAAAAVRS